MNTLIINHTKRPSAILTDGIRVIGYKEEDLTYRGNSSYPAHAIDEARGGSFISALDTFVNVRTDNAEYNPFMDTTIAQDNIKHLARSAVKWCYAQAEWLRVNRHAVPEGFTNQERPIHVIASAMFSQGQKGIAVYKVDRNSTDRDTQEIGEVLSGCGYLANLELYLHVLGVPENIEERERFEARAATIMDVLTTKQLKITGDIIDAIEQRIFSEINTPVFIEPHNQDIDRRAFGEAYDAIKLFIDTELNTLGLTDTQTLEGVRSRVATRLVWLFVTHLIENFKMDNVILVGAAFHNKAANLDLLNGSVVGFLSVAPFDIEDGVLLHLLPFDVLGGDMRIGPVRFLHELQDRARDNEEYSIVLSDKLCLFNTISLDSAVIGLNTGASRYKDCELCGEQPYVGWITKYSPIPNVIGSDRFGLIGNTIQTKLGAGIEVRPYYLRSGSMIKKPFTRFEIESINKPFILK